MLGDMHGDDDGLVAIDWCRGRHPGVGDDDDETATCAAHYEWWDDDRRLSAGDDEDLGRDGLARGVDACDDGGILHGVGHSGGLHCFRLRRRATGTRTEDDDDDWVRDGGFGPTTAPSESPRRIWLRLLRLVQMWGEPAHARVVWLAWPLGRCRQTRPEVRDCEYEVLRLRRLRTTVTDWNGSGSVNDSTRTRAAARDATLSSTTLYQLRTSWRGPVLTTSAGTSDLAWLRYGSGFHVAIRAAPTRFHPTPVEFPRHRRPHLRRHDVRSGAGQHRRLRRRRRRSLRRRRGHRDRGNLEGPPPSSPRGGNRGDVHRGRRDRERGSNGHERDFEQLDSRRRRRNQQSRDGRGRRRRFRRRHDDQRGYAHHHGVRRRRVLRRQAAATASAGLGGGGIIAGAVAGVAVLAAIGVGAYVYMRSKTSGADSPPLAEVQLAGSADESALPKAVASAPPIMPPPPPTDGRSRLQLRCPDPAAVLLAVRRPHVVRNSSGACSYPACLNKSPEVYNKTRA